MQSLSSDRGLREWGRKAAPYLLLEILLPGGTLFALLLYLSRRCKWSVASAVPGNIMPACRIAPGAAD